jgi:hypothetical protein
MHGGDFPSLLYQNLFIYDFKGPPESMKTWKVCRK